QDQGHQKHLAMIQTEKEYNAIVERVEELLQNPDNIENQDAKGYVELNLLSDLVSDYEERHYPVKKPSLVEVVKLRMAEMGLNQKRLSLLLGISTSRVSEYLNGKSEPTLKVARDISVKLSIDASIVLGV
ncbi:MAG: helix-turn-helix domain-containing protein, partial [Flavobacteriaceae bacterium]